MVRTKRHQNAFFTLGGKIEEGETGIEALHREVSEEVASRIKEGTLRFLKEFEAPAFGKENTLVNIKLYHGELASEPLPSSEIEEIRFFDTTADPKHLTAITIDMFNWLKERDYIA